MDELARQKYLMVGQFRQRLHIPTRNRYWLSTVLCCLDGIELYLEDL